MYEIIYEVVSTKSVLKKIALNDLDLWFLLEEILKSKLFKLIEIRNIKYVRR